MLKQIFLIPCILFITNTICFAQVFGSRIELGPVQYNPVTEASGIAASRKNDDVLWLHNDSGDLSRLYAMNTEGEHLGVYNINGIIAARDWEDIAVGPGPVFGENYIYIADIGDNSAVYNLKYIHRVLEPTVSSMQSPLETDLDNVETITYQYSDGNRDAETLMIDPLTRDIYVVSKRETNVNVYRIPFPQSTGETIIINSVATLDLGGEAVPPLSWTVGGDISNSGLEILIKTGGTIYYWSRSAAQDLWDAFSNTPITVPYIVESQGEAVAWESSAQGYFTVSEETMTAPVAYLYYYPRQDSPLPVKLSSFIAFAKNNSVKLEWTTESEINNWGFQIERMNRDKSWDIIGFVNGHGNSSTKKYYTFVDKNISASDVFYYRLKQIDYSGQYEYSEVLEVFILHSTEIKINKNWPNPFNTITKIDYDVRTEADVSLWINLSIFNTRGQKIATLVNKRQISGNYSVQWDASNMPSGIYIYTLETSSGFSKSRKLILLK